MTTTSRLLVALATLTLATAALAAERGYFGFSLAIDGDGFVLNPTLKSVKVDQVVPRSPAAQAGIVPGDQIVEIEGQPVVGAKAKSLQPYIEREIGQSTRLVIRKASGATVPLVLVAGPKIEAP